MRNGTIIAAVLCLLVVAALGQGAKKPEKLDCLSCHNEPSLTKEVEGKEHSLFVDGAVFHGSAHGPLACNDCHADIKAFPHDPTPKPVACETCHADEVQSYLRSVHGVARHNGNNRAAQCLDCHGGNAHAIVPSTELTSPVHHTNVPQTCGRCHGEKFVMDSSGHTNTQQFTSYQQSVHGRAVAAGSEKAAVCTDCHGTHEILPPGNVKSSIFKFNVPATCGQCHQDIATQYTQSIHGQAIARGVWQAPVCTDCHGIHAIKQHLDPKSQVANETIARTTCAQCHESVRLSEEFGVPSQRVSSYMDSYHGMASALGSKVVANCASCHGVHNILPSSDPRSTINPAHLVQTCGQCHPGANQRFVTAKVHIDVPLSRDMGSIGTAWVRRFYLWLIGLVIGGMLLHNVIILRRKLQLARAQVRTVPRMSENQRWQHLVLLTSFIVLVITGFALKFPDSLFAAMLGYSEPLRHIGHRVAGVVLLGVGAYHLYYLLRKPEGRQLIRDFLPRYQDVRDLVATLRYYLGWSDKKPQYARFNYADKAEYFALVWGTILMGVTGLMMWFKVIVSRLMLPRWTVDIASAFHFYEAILAALAILVWHFYFVIFDPDVYPVNWAFWDGRISEHHYREHHARQYEEEQARAEAERAEGAKQDGPGS
jgi:formate dehydrogenase gamma subunit